MNGSMEPRELSELFSVMDHHGPEIVDEMIRLIREYESVMGDTKTPLDWKFQISEGGTVSLDVTPAEEA